MLSFRTFMSVTTVRGVGWSLEGLSKKEKRERKFMDTDNRVVIPGRSGGQVGG